MSSGAFSQIALWQAGTCSFFVAIAGATRLWLAHGSCLDLGTHSRNHVYEHTSLRTCIRGTCTEHASLYAYLVKF